MRVKFVGAVYHVIARGTDRLAGGSIAHAVGAVAVKSESVQRTESTPTGWRSMKRGSRLNLTSVLLHSLVSILLILASLVFAMKLRQSGHSWIPHLIATVFFAVPIAYPFCVFAYSQK